jgi:ABC-type lipoprotein export system ATPase subunit
MREYQYPGSRWWKFDFHTHTPASSDFDASEISTLQPRDWLLAYMRKGVDCVAVTDHNTSGWIEKLQTALLEMESENPVPHGYRPLVLFPGVEITTSDSLHILAIFDPTVGKSVLDGLLVGKLTISNSGKPTAELMVSESTSSVIDAIHALNGLAIAAHVEQDNGLLQGALNDKGTFESKKSGRLIDDVLPKLDGLEFQNLSSDSFRYFKSRIAHYAHVSGSDWPHKSTNAGSRFTWVKMSAPSFDGLRLALLDPESAIERSDQSIDNPQTLPEQWIESITLENMHLRRNGHGPLTLRFNPAYNAIIGGRGSGKSTVLECLRLALAREGELKKLDKSADIWKTFESFRCEYMPKDQLGMMLPNTKITVVAVKGKGESAQKLQFIWSKVNSSFVSQVQRWDGDKWQETGLNEQQVNALFPVKIFSQKQILALANNPQALLEHIDNSITDQKKAWLQEFDVCKSTLLAARLRVRTLKKELANKPALELEYKEASRKALLFSNSNFGVLLKAYQRATQQQRALDDFYQLLANDISGLKTGLNQAANLASTELAHFLTESSVEVAAHDSAITLKDQLTEKYQQIVAMVASMQTLFDTAQTARSTSNWQQENQTHIQAYQDETARLKSLGINSAQEAGLAVAAEEKLRKQIEQLRVFEMELVQAEEAVEAAVQALIQCRLTLTDARVQLINRLLEQNDTLKVSLCSMASMKSEVKRFREILKLDGDGENFAANIWLEKSLEDMEEDKDKNQASGMLADVISTKVPQFIPDRLVELKVALEEMNAKKHDGMILNTKLRAELVRRIEALPYEAFDELSCWFPEDEVNLEYRPKKGLKYQKIHAASAGQKTAAMLSFLLIHGDEPLLLDQPEDDLDNAIVSELVVEQLRKNKAHRQLLVVTHNANIVVNADADLVITMDFNGQIDSTSAGGLQETAVRKDICRVMEGGEEAFRQRYKRILEDLETKV